MPGCHLSIQQEQDPNTSSWKKGTPATSGEKILCAHPPPTSEGDSTPRPLTEAGETAPNTDAAGAEDGNLSPSGRERVYVLIRAEDSSHRFLEREGDHSNACSRVVSHRIHSWQKEGTPRPPPSPLAEILATAAAGAKGRCPSPLHMRLAKVHIGRSVGSWC